MFTTNASLKLRNAGVSLVELIVFIVLVGVAVAGVLGALNLSTRASVDPMTQKQALAIAEAIMEEVQLQPFTYCDPDDANAGSAVNTGGCATVVEATGPEAAGAPAGGPVETRTGDTRPFDNVNDYHSFAMNGVADIAGGTSIPQLAGYTTNVTVASQA